MSRPGLLAAAFLSVAGFAFAQAPRPTPSPRSAAPQVPTFGADARVVQVDLVVMNSSGRMVSGLSADDFILKEDGKERKITSFAAFSAERKNAAGPEEIVIEPYPRATPEPEPEADAVTVLFVDDGQLSPQDAMRLRPALKRLLDTLAAKNGALALVAPWSNISIANEVRGNRAVFAAAIDKINGRRADERGNLPMSDAEAFAIERGETPMITRLTLRFVTLNPGFDPDQAAVAVRMRATEVAREARNRREDAYGVLLRSLDWLIRQPGRHSVVMVSGGFAWDQDDQQQRDVVTRSLEARAPIHFLDARGLAGAGLFQGVEYGPAMELDAGEAPFAFAHAAEGSVGLAEDTGGLVVQNRNNFTAGLEQMVETMTTYYILGYEPVDHAKPGFRKIKVELRTKGLKVVARRGYYDRGVKR